MINVKQLGAYGDGEHDDYNPINKAISHSKNIRIPKGTYKINSQININNNVIIQGDAIDTFITTSTIQVNSGKTVEFNSLYFKDNNRHAIYSNGGIVIVRNCHFNNITYGRDNVTAFGTIYVKENFDLTVDNCVFENIHSQGAIYTYENGKILITNNYFNLCDYRALNIISGTVEGLIYNNDIIDCGKNNTASTGGVACNGIYMPAGDNVIVDNNRIIRPRENAIEGHAKKIINNYIEDTNATLQTHDTPSVEAIFISKDCNCEIAYNTIKKARRRGISSPGTGDSQNNGEMYIHDNYIDTMVEGEGFTNYAIWLQSGANGGLSNKRVENNFVKNKIAFLKGNKTNSFVGDITFLNQDEFGVGKIRTENDKLFTIYKYFTDITDLEGWRYINSTPSIVDIEDGNGAKALHMDHQSYAKLISPPLRFGNHILTQIAIYGKGDYTVDWYKNDSYSNSVLDISGLTDYVLKTSAWKIYSTTELSKNEFRIFPKSGLSFDIAYIKIDYYIID